MITRLLKASELPPGTRMLPRAGAALSGVELVEAALRAVEALAEAEGTKEKVVEEVIERLRVELQNGSWYGAHLTYPQARIEIAATGSESTFRAEVNIQLTAKLRVQAGAGKMSEKMWEAYKKVKVFGPSNIPDDMREQMGLSLTAQFRLPGGDIVTAELETEDPARQDGPLWGPRRGEARRDIPTSQAIPLTRNPVPLGADLVGELASEPPVAPIGPVEKPKVEAVKTVKGRKSKK